MRVFFFVLGEQQRAGGPRLVSLKTKDKKPSRPSKTIRVCCVQQRRIETSAHAALQQYFNEFSLFKDRAPFRSLVSVIAQQ